MSKFASNRVCWSGACISANYNFCYDLRSFSGAFLAILPLNLPAFHVPRALLESSDVLVSHLLLPDCFSEHWIWLWLTGDIGFGGEFILCCFLKECEAFPLPRDELTWRWHMQYLPFTCSNIELCKLAHSCLLIWVGVSDLHANWTSREEYVVWRAQSRCVASILSFRIFLIWLWMTGGICFVVFSYL